jgi:hypothetical protein
MEDNEKTDRKTEHFCLFVCLELYEKFVSYLVVLIITGDRAANLKLYA